LREEKTIETSNSFVARSISGRIRRISPSKHVPEQKQRNSVFSAGFAEKRALGKQTKIKPLYSPFIEAQSLRAAFSGSSARVISRPTIK
jgi:hypothetical protein